jgi:hypothetical protein
MAYTSIALIICILFIIAAIVLQFIAGSNLPIGTTALSSSNSVAGNKTALGYLNGSAYLNILLLIVCMIALCVFIIEGGVPDNKIITNPMDYQFNWAVLFLILPLISLIVIILLAVGYSFISSTVTTTNNVSYSQILTISALVINVIIFIILICTYIWGLRGYNQYVQDLFDKQQQAQKPKETYEESIARIDNFSEERGNFYKQAYNIT